MVHSDKNHKKMSDHLPREFLKDVLARLPVKSLLRFRCVSRTWYSVNHSPAFIAYHIHKTTNTKNCKLLLFRFYDRGAREQYYVYPEDLFPDIHIEEFYSPLKLSDNYYADIVGSCNGLLCLMDRSPFATRYVLWNPSIRKHVAIPQPHYKQQDREYFHGFGFDSSTNDFKLVRGLYLKNTNWESREPPLVEIYSLKHGSWRMVAVPPSDQCFIKKKHSAFVNGACHWVADKLERQSLLIAFDVNKEVFSEIAVPDSLTARAARRDFQVIVSNGLLSLVSLPGMYVENCSVWVMTEYGEAKTWVNVFNISIYPRVERAIAMTKNGQFVYARYGHVISYDPGSGQIQTNQMRGESISFYLNTYVESLALMTEENGVLSSSASAGSWKKLHNNNKNDE